MDTLDKDSYDKFLIQSIHSGTSLKFLEKCDTVDMNMYSLIKNQNTYDTVVFEFQNSTKTK